MISGSSIGSVAGASVPSAWTIMRGPPTLRPIALSTSVGDLLAVERLAVEQRPGDGIEAGAVLLEHLAAPLLLVAEDVLDLFVDHARRLVGVVA